MARVNLTVSFDILPDLGQDVEVAVEEIAAEVEETIGRRVFIVDLTTSYGETTNYPSAVHPSQADFDLHPSAMRAPGLRVVK